MAFEKTQNKLDELRNLTWQNGKLVEALSQLSVNGLETELQQGKSNIVGAIKSKGVYASVDESMTSLADKITKIKEVEVKTLPAETSNEKANDLFNMVMKSQGWDSIYETVYENYVTNGGYVGVLMTALERGTRTSIALTGADAYYILEEDKFYTTDENRNLVTFINGVETKLGTKNHLWDIDNAQYWRHVFYLYVEGSTADGNREKVHVSAIDYCNNSNIPNIQYKSTSGNIMHFHVSNPDTCNLKWNDGSTVNTRCYYFYTNVENANAQWMLYNNQNALTFVNFEGLKKLASGTLLQSSRVKKLDFPNLTEVTDGTLINQCNALESVDFPNLTEVTDGTLINQCNALESVDFPNLTEVTGGTLINQCNALESVDLSNADIVKSNHVNRGVLTLGNTSRLKKIILKNKVNVYGVLFGVNNNQSTLDNISVFSKEIISTSTTIPDFSAKNILFETLKRGRIWCGGASGYSNYTTKRIQLMSKGNRNDVLEILHTNNSSGKYILNDIEIAEGTRQTLTFTKHELDKENIVNHIFKKLADNNFEDDGVTPAPAIKITIGSNNLDKLTDEEKAIATDKNYILA